MLHILLCSWQFILSGTWSHLCFAGVREGPPWCSIVGATVTVHQFFCILQLCCCRKSLPADSRHSNGYELYPSSRRYLSVLIRSGFHTLSLCSQRERNSISVQSFLQVHWWCIVHKQPRFRVLSGPDESCWTCHQRHNSAHQLCFLPKFTTVDREGWSTSHFNLRQTRWFQFPHHKLSVP